MRKGRLSRRLGAYRDLSAKTSVSSIGFTSSKEDAEERALRQLGLKSRGSSDANRANKMLRSISDQKSISQQRGQFTNNFRSSSRLGTEWRSIRLKETEGKCYERSRSSSQLS